MLSYINEKKKKLPTYRPEKILKRFRKQDIYFFFGLIFNTYSNSFSGFLVPISIETTRGKSAAETNTCSSCKSSVKIVRFEICR